MKTIRQKQKMALDLAMLFLEQGKVLDATEYKGLNPVPVSLGTLKSIFGSYPRAVNYAKFSNPEAFDELNSKPKKVEKKPEVKKVVVVDDPITLLKSKTS